MSQRKARRAELAPFAPRSRMIRDEEVPDMVRTGELTACPWCGLRVVINAVKSAILHQPEQCERFTQEVETAPSFEEASRRIKAAAVQS